MPAASCRALLAASPPPEPATVPCRPLPATRAGRGATGRAAALGDREQEDEKRESSRERSREQERRYFPISTVQSVSPDVVVLV